MHVGPTCFVVIQHSIFLQKARMSFMSIMVLRLDLTFNLSGRNLTAVEGRSSSQRHGNALVLLRPLSFIRNSSFRRVSPMSMRHQQEHFCKSLGSPLSINPLSVAKWFWSFTFKCGNYHGKRKVLQLASYKFCIINLP